VEYGLKAHIFAENNALLVTGRNDGLITDNTSKDMKGKTALIIYKSKGFFNLTKWMPLIISLNSSRPT
jgi:hypothetical protein